MNSSYDSDGVQFAFDATTLSTAEQCLRKYDLSIRQGWQPRQKSVHLLFGGWYATALEHYHKHIAEGEEPEQALILVVHQALKMTWEFDTEPTVEGDPGYPDGRNIIPGTGQPWLSTHNTKTRENLIRTIVWYQAHFADDATKVIQLANGKPAVELSFTLEVDNDNLFCGHLDRLCKYGDRTYVMDQKTTQNTISQQYYKQFSNDTQMSMYSFAARAVYQTRVHGVIIDAAQIAVGFTRFERGFTFRSEAILDEWYNDTMLTIERIKRATRDGYFPMNRSACNNYGGCQFREICSRSPEVRPQFLKGDFVKQTKTWDPLERR